MTDRDMTAIVTAVDKVAAIERVRLLDPEGADGYFSVPLATEPGLTDPGLATHWGQSGYTREDVAAMLEQSVAPMVKTFPNENTTFNQNLTLCDPVLHRIYEEL